MLLPEIVETAIAEEPSHKKLKKLFKKYADKLLNPDESD